MAECRVGFNKASVFILRVAAAATEECAAGMAMSEAHPKPSKLDYVLKPLNLAP